MAQKKSNMNGFPWGYFTLLIGVVFFITPFITISSGPHLVWLAKFQQYLPTLRVFAIFFLGFFVVTWKKNKRVLNTLGYRKLWESYKVGPLVVTRVINGVVTYNLLEVGVK